MSSLTRKFSFKIIAPFEILQFLHWGLLFCRTLYRSIDAILVQQ